MTETSITITTTQTEDTERIMIFTKKINESDTNQKRYHHHQRQ